MYTSKKIKLIFKKTNCPRTIFRGDHKNRFVYVLDIEKRKKRGTGKRTGGVVVNGTIM